MTNNKELLWPRDRQELQTVQGYNKLVNVIIVLRGEVKLLRNVLKEVRDKWDTSDNGVCSICRIGHRLYDDSSNLRQCENAQCLSHRIYKALTYDEPCDVCGKTMESTDKKEQIENALFGAHSNCMEDEKEAERV